jgi:hypothetical protein
VNRSWPFRLVNHHLIAEVGGRQVLVDTGSPTTMGEPGPTFVGKTDQADPSASVDLNWISQQVGTRVDAILGMDILGGESFFVDFEKSEIRFGCRPRQPGDAVFPITETVGNVPVISLPVGDISIRAFVDTGAPLSYLNSSLVAGFSITRVARDFHPSMGEFETPVYRVPYRVYNRNRIAEWGVLPQRFEQLMLGSRIQGIVGISLLHKHGVGFDVPKREFFLAN